MENLETKYSNLIVDVNGEKKISLPVPVLNPYKCKVYGKEIAEAAGISVEELSALLCEDAVLDVKTGKVCDGETSDGKITAVLAVERLLKKRSPQAVGKYIMSELLMCNDERLHDRYERILNRVSRYAKLIELDSPAIVSGHEARMVQEAVNELFFGGSVQITDAEVITEEPRQDGICLWDIVAKLLNL